MRWRAAILPAAALALAAQAVPAAGTGLQPYQLVRSLQLVQDRIADGDHAALPMQRKILEMVDARLAASTPEDFSDHRNFRALMIYAMSGGNPATVSKIVSGLVLDEKDARLGAGLIQYTKGDLGRASAALRDAEPSDVPADIGHILALVKGMILAGQDPKRALGYLDYARLVGPGTLIEEAALRRSISLSIEIEDRDRFLQASAQYVRRFLNSPYASQFADSFVAGITRLHSKIDLELAAAIIDGMTQEQAKVIYLRIARQAAIERLSALLSFAKNALESYAPQSLDDPRATLYSALAQVASEEVMDVRKRLALIDASRLSSSDRVLLEAAKALVENVVSLPVTSSIGPAGADPGADGEPDPPSKERIATSSATVEGREGGKPVEGFVSETRRRIEAVDKLLEESRP